MRGVTYGQIFRILLSALLSGSMMTVLFFFWRCMFSMCVSLFKDAGAAFTDCRFFFRREKSIAVFTPKQGKGACAFLYDFITVFSGGILFLLFSYAALSGVFRFYALFFFLLGFALSACLFRPIEDLFLAKIFPLFLLPALFSAYALLYALHRLFHVGYRFLWSPIMKKCVYHSRRQKHRRTFHRKMLEMREYSGKTFFHNN